MIELVLRIPSPHILDKLLPILQRLKIKYQTRTIAPLKKDMSKKAAIITKIQSGAMNLPNFNQTMTDFEESRQDRVLYGRD